MIHKSMAAWILLLICLGAIQEQLTSVNGQMNSNVENHFDMYKKLFALKRKEQIQTAEQVWSVRDYAKQYKTVKFLMETVFPVLKQSLLDVAKMHYVPDDPFPDDLEKREVLGKIYENVLFFGDVLLRMPDITKKIYREHKREWQSVLEESIQFCNASRKLFNGPYTTQLHLMAQEIGIIPEQDDYVNPFRITKSSPEKEKKRPESSSKVKGSKKKSRPKLRGSKFEL